MQAHTLPTRIVVNNKLIYTEKLVADLHFWSEVERWAFNLFVTEVPII